MSRYAIPVVLAGTNHPILKRIREKKNGCWVIPGIRFLKGYAQISVLGSRVSASRYIWGLLREPLEAGQLLYHKCDGGGACLNPDHKQVGGRAANFWDYVEKTPEGCWLFKGALDDDGYGKLSFEGKTELAHRVAYLLAHGPIPDSLYVLHDPICTSKACVNPAHLRVGTQKENMQDVKIKKELMRLLQEVRVEDVADD